MNRTIKILAATGLALALPGVALAHPGHAGHDVLGLTGGLLHPLTGLDHVLAMVAVGLWAALRGEKAVVTWPATFIFAMLVGFAASSFLGGGAFVEPAILASVIVLGVATAVNVQLPEGVVLALLASFGALHGYAHGAEAVGGRTGFEIGMVATTALLHLTGVFAGAGLQRFGRPDLVRWLGAGAAVGGLALAVAG